MVLWLWITASAVAVIAVFVIALSAMFTKRVTSPPRRKPLPAELARLEGLRSREVSFRSTDGIRLHGLFLEGPPDTDAAVVVCHGLGANKENLLGIGRLLNLAGYPVLLFDFRGHGESAQDSISIGPKESADVLGAFRFLREEGYRRFGLFGLSMGAAAAAYAAPKVPELAIVALDSCPASLRRIVDHLRKRQRVVIGLGGGFVQAFWKVFTGVPAREVRPLGEIGKINAPLLLIHGDADRLIDPGDLDLLYAEAKGPKEKMLIPGAGHGETFAKGGDAYQDAVRRHFVTGLGERPTTPSD